MQLIHHSIGLSSHMPKQLIQMSTIILSLSPTFAWFGNGLVITKFMETSQWISSIPSLLDSSVDKNLTWFTTFLTLVQFNIESTSTVVCLAWFKKGCQAVVSTVSSLPEKQNCQTCSCSNQIIWTTCWSLHWCSHWL